MTDTMPTPTPQTDVDPTTQGRVEWLPERHFRAEDGAMLWFHDLLHNGPPSTPMGASLHHWPRGTKYASEFLQFPFSRGFDYILFYGRIYPGPIPVTDPAEIEARLPHFQAKMGDLLENWPERYQEMTDEWTSMLSYLRGIRKDVLPLDKLLMVLRDAVDISKRSWELHFVGMYPEIVAYQTFEAVCAKNGIEERQMRTFLQGFETKMYEIDRGMWWLADLAGQLGLTETFIESDNMVDLYGRLKESDKGTVWLDEFDLFLKKFGRRTTAALFDPYYKTWLEDPYPALSTIRTYVQKGGFDYEEHTRRIIEERDQYIEETLARLTDPAAREEFETALRHAQNTYPFNEDHNFYVEQWTYSELRYVILECGRRLEQYGITEDLDDVFFLTVDELDSILVELIDDEFMGIAEHSRRVPSLVARRKEEWTALHEIQPPTFIGTIPEERVDDPVFIKIWGFTNEVIKGEARPDEDVAGQIEGMPGAPGEVEGIARVILGYEGFSEVQPDDILVAPFTTPAWTPLFSKIKGVVTDSGGMLAHAAICAREYDIPSVVGTITRGKHATQLIKTGDRIRVNGTDGIVQILSD